VEDMAIVDTVLGPMDNDSYYHRDWTSYEKVESKLSNIL